MKNKLMILAGLLSLNVLNATEISVNRHQQAFLECLYDARQARAEGNYSQAGRTFNSLAENGNVAGLQQPESRPGREIADAAQSELDDMRANGQWDDTMLSRTVGK